MPFGIKGHEPKIRLSHTPVNCVLPDLLVVDTRRVLISAPDFTLRVREILRIALALGYAREHFGDEVVRSRVFTPWVQCTNPRNMTQGSSPVTHVSVLMSRVLYRRG